MYNLIQLGQKGNIVYGIIYLIIFCFCIIY